MVVGSRIVLTCQVPFDYEVGSVGFGRKDEGLYVNRMY